MLELYMVGGLNDVLGNLIEKENDRQGSNARYNGSSCAPKYFSNKEDHCDNENTVRRSDRLLPDNNKHPNPKMIPLALDKTHIGTET